MEDIIKTILDVVRVQHSATEGTDQKPFDMDDVVDMAMGVIGRPESPSETESMASSIQKMVEALAPDLFPPKTLEEMDDAERVASVTSMLENRLINGFTPRANQSARPAEEPAAQAAASDTAQTSVSDTAQAVTSDPVQTAASDISDRQSSMQSGDLGPSTGADEADFTLAPEQFETIMEGLKAEGLTDGIDPREAARLNDIIYQNLMEVMGAKPPRVEFPFDRSQIRYGKEKSITEQLAEEEAEKQEQARRAPRPESTLKTESPPQTESSSQITGAAQSENISPAAAGQAAKPRMSAADLAQSMIEQEEPSQLSAWDLALNAVNEDEEKNKKEPYKPKPVEEPKTKSASQLAAEAIARAQEEDRMKLEIERQAEALMAEAQKRGQDPMKFALHQQEILRYMEKKSDELVSFEDYEDLSPEEKLEVERQIYIEKQIAEGVDPDQVDTQVPEEYIPPELKTASAASSAPEADKTGESQGTQPGTATPPVMTEEMLRMLSQEVVRENAAMILAENADEDMASLEEMIFQNLKKTMGGSGVPVPPEDVGDLIEQAITANRESQLGYAPAEEGPAASSTASASGIATTGGGSGEARTQTGEGIGASAGKQDGGFGGKKDYSVAPEKIVISEDRDEEKSHPETEKTQPQLADSSESGSASLKGLSAVELARAAQKAAKVEPKPDRKTVSAADIAREAQEKALRAKLNPQPADGGSAAGSATAETDAAGKTGESVTTSPTAATKETLPAADEADTTNVKAEVEISEGLFEESAEGDIFDDIDVEISVDDNSLEVADSDIEEDEYEYVDPDELVLGEHTQAEVDEALENLSTLGLEGEVYERAKRMLLLELAGSEAELIAWLEQEKKKAKNSVPSRSEKDSIDDISDIDEDELERELEMALDEDFLGEDFLEEDEVDDQAGESEETDAQEETQTDDLAEKESAEDDSQAEESEGEAFSEEKSAEDDSQAEESEGEMSSEEKSAEDDSRAEETEGEMSSEEKSAEDDSQAEEAEGETSSEEKSAEDDNQEAESEAEGNLEIDDSEEEDLAEDESRHNEFEIDTEDLIESEPAEDGIIDVEPVDDEGEVIEVIRESDDEEDAGIESSDAHGTHETSEGSAETAATLKDKSSHRKKVFRKREKAASKDIKDRFTQVDSDRKAEEKSYQVSTRKPFILKNSASFMDQFEDYIADTQENRRLSTGFKKLDAMLRYGLHKGSYFIDAQPQYLKNSFMQQIADRAAESGIDVLYISTELSRYDLMVETISRLSYEIHHGDPANAVSPMAIMTGEDGADLGSLKDELNWYRGRISEHLFILDQESVSDYAASSEAESAGDVLIELITSIVREGAHKPVVVIDNIENIISTEDSEDMKPFMEGMKKLAKELGIPILMSYGYAQAESEEELYPEEKEYHEHLGNMCDVYLELVYAEMISEDMLPLTQEDVRDMAQEGESLLINILIHKNRRPMKATLQIQGTPKYNYFEE